MTTRESEDGKPYGIGFVLERFTGYWETNEYAIIIDEEERKGFCDRFC